MNSYEITETTTYPEDGWDDTGIIEKGNLILTPLSLNKSELSREESRKKFFLVCDKVTKICYEPIVFLAGFNYVVKADTKQSVEGDDVLYDIVHDEMVRLGTLEEIKINSHGDDTINHDGKILGRVHNKVLYIENNVRLQDIESNPESVYSDVPNPLTQPESNHESFYYGIHSRKPRYVPPRSHRRWFSRGGKSTIKKRKDKQSTIKYRKRRKGSKSFRLFKPYSK